MAGKRKEKTPYSKEQIENLGKRIRQLRKAAGFSGHDKFAYKHDISRTQYANYERGADMHFSTLMNLLEFLEISPADFFSEGFDIESEGKEK